MTGLVERYLQRLATQRGCSPRTIEGYRTDLAILALIAAARDSSKATGGWEVNERAGARENADVHETADVPERGEVPGKVELPERADVPERVEVPGRAEPDWRRLTEHDIRRWVAAESRAGRAPKSTARRLSAWRGFYDWLVAEGCASANPARGVRAPRAARRLPKALSPDQALSLVASQPGGEDFESLRDTAMLELFYSSGLRLSELTSLDLRYFDGRDGGADSSSWYSADEAEVIVTGKGGRRRSVPVGAHARAALGHWIAARAAWLVAHAGADPRPLFLSARGARLANRTVQARLKRIAIERGIPANVHPHVLRHSFASHLLQSSGDLRAVQELLGHASIATTQIYTSLDFQRLAAVYDATHPRARRR